MLAGLHPDTPLKDLEGFRLVAHLKGVEIPAVDIKRHFGRLIARLVSRRANPDDIFTILSKMMP